MGKRRKSRQPDGAPRPPAEQPSPPLPTGQTAPATRRAGLVEALQAIALGKVVGLTLGWGIRLYAALFLGFGAIILNVGWQQGPKKVIEAIEFADFTAGAEGRIVESWLAIEFDPAAVGEARRWRASAKASPCAVVEYDGEWGELARRAFCGNRLGFNESYTLHDLKSMAPGIPFAWSRDRAGFALPEIRLSEASLRWLATSKPTDSVYFTVPANALAQLERDVDRPVDVAVESWAAPQPAFALALDPKAPGGAMPAGYVEARRQMNGNWVVAVMFLAVGFALWFAGTAIVLPALPRPVHLFLAALPVLALPWWGDAIPRYLRHLNPDVAMVVSDMLGETDITGRLVASDPAGAILADGEVLRWPAGGGAYAGTFGKIRFSRPEPAPRDADAALAALTATAAAQVRAMADGERAALFHQLELDKHAEHRRAGLLFLPAAREAATDPRVAAEVRKAAGDFLSAWVTQPVEEPWPRDAGFEERIRLFQSLKDVPISEVAIMSASIAQRAVQRSTQGR